MFVRRALLPAEPWPRPSSSYFGRALHPAALHKESSTTGMYHPCLVAQLDVPNPSVTWAVTSQFCAMASFLVTRLLHLTLTAMHEARGSLPLLKPHPNQHPQGTSQVLPSAFGVPRDAVFTKLKVTQQSSAWKQSSQNSIRQPPPAAASKRCCVLSCQILVPAPSADGVLPSNLA